MFHRSQHLTSGLFVALLLLLLTGVVAVTTAAGPDQQTATIPDAPDPAQPGPYQAGFRRVTITRPDATTFDAVLYYPAVSPGRQAPYDGSGAPYPAVVFGHGFLTPPRLYLGNAQHLASWGYFMILPASALELFPSHPAFADDFSYTLDYLEAQNNDSSSALYQQIAVDRLGAAGHSMGGGVSILAAAQDSRIQAVLTLAAAETFPDSAIEAIASLEVPVVLLAGSDDIIAPVANHQQPMYDNALAPRLLAILQGGNHCSFASQLSACGGTMDDDYQLAITQRWTTAFFNLYLKEELAYGYYVWGPGMVLDPDVVSQVDAGFTVMPFEQTQVGAPGQVVSYTLTLTNTGDSPASFSLSATDAAWPTQATPAVTPVLPPGDATTITIQVAIPAAPTETSDTAVIIALSNLDSLTSQTGLVTTTLP